MVDIQNSMDEAKKKANPQAEQDAAVNSSLSRIKNKIMVMSGKGGVGKTSTSVNLSIALANKGFKVGIMDVDLHGPDVPRMLGLEGMLGLSKNKKLEPMRSIKNLKAVSIESLTSSKDDAIIWRGPIKYSAIKQFIGDVEWGDLDFLVIDSPPGTGDEPLTIAQTITDAKAVIITTPQEVSLADVRKSIAVSSVRTATRTWTSSDPAVASAQRLKPESGFWARCLLTRRWLPAVTRAHPFRKNTSIPRFQRRSRILLTRSPNWRNK